ncbi:collagen-like protein [Pseudozobellia thermophila]|nr:collagen-like protein [Pseudozobellia thermophila]
MKYSLVAKVVSVLLVLTLNVSCSKDGQGGETGPAGPQGEQGIQGETGPAGQDGEDGQNGAQGAQGEPGEDGQDGEQGEAGTANVIYSEWFNTELGDDIGAQAISFLVDFPEGNTKLMDTGAIFVFGRRIFLEGITGDLVYLFYQLPVMFNGSNNQYSFLVHNGDEIQIFVQSMDGGPVGDGTFIQQYRYVVIPGGTPSSAKSMEGPDLGQMDYEELCRYLNIPQ